MFVERGEARRKKYYSENIFYVAFWLGGKEQHHQKHPERTSITKEAYLGERSRSMVARVKRHFRRYKQSIDRQTDGGKLRRLARKTLPSWRTIRGTSMRATHSRTNIRISS